MVQNLPMKIQVVTGLLALLFLYSCTEKSVNQEVNSVVDSVSTPEFIPSLSPFTAHLTHALNEPVVSDNLESMQQLVQNYNSKSWAELPPVAALNITGNLLYDAENKVAKKVSVRFDFGGVKQDYNVYYTLNVPTVVEFSDASNTLNFVSKETMKNVESMSTETDSIALKANMAVVLAEFVKYNSIDANTTTAEVDSNALSLIPGERYKSLFGLNAEWVSVKDKFWYHALYSPCNELVFSKVVDFSSGDFYIVRSHFSYFKIEVKTDASSGEQFFAGFTPLTYEDLMELGETYQTVW